MRIAILADIHGNTIALDAVLADIEARGGADAYWVLGDLVAIGYDPIGVLGRLLTLPQTTIISGNTDRFATTSDRPHPTIEDATANPALIPALVEVAGSFAWTKGYLTARGWLGWMQALPLEARLTLQDGTRVLLVHAAPGLDDGEGLNPGLSDESLRAMLAGAEADLICVGHFHMPMSRMLDDHHVVNPGSVSNNFMPDLRAAYAILEADERQHAITFYRVEYDREAVIEATEHSGNPAAPYIVRFLKGEVRASWLAGWDGVAHLPTTANE